MLLTSEDFKSVVIDGARKHNGMASFTRFMTPADAEDVRAYVISEARKDAAGAPTPVASGAK
jgi:quinohemoprotein ethanol dehydrogenase